MRIVLIFAVFASFIATLDARTIAGGPSLFFASNLNSD